MCERSGGEVVVESLERLGADTCFGLPGQHALPIFEGLRTRAIRYVGLRTELSAAFAADGYARVTGRAAPLLLSTGPGALMSLAGLMEAEGSSVPVVAVASQVPRDGIGRRRGYIHELRDQRASFDKVVKRTFHASSVELIPRVLASAWSHALTPPTGPVFVEVPNDVLRERTDVTVGELRAEPGRIEPDPAALASVAELLSDADSPVILAGGGVVRSAGWNELAALAQQLGAPVAMTYGGRGAFPDDHPLCAGSFCEDPDFIGLLGDADVLLAVGTALGEETTNHFTLTPRGRVVQVDADAEKIGASIDATGLVGDAADVLRRLAAQVERRGDASSGPARAARTREAVERRIGSQGRELERSILATLRDALPADAVHCWDMTIIAYWAAPRFPAGSPRRFLWPQGSGTLGYAWPAAIGASTALADTPVVAISGDGGALYGLQELATARQAGVSAKWLIVDDGHYGVLREYQQQEYGNDFGMGLTQPDFVAVARAFAVPARETSPDRLEAGLRWLLNEDGPAVLVLPVSVAMFAPTHETEAVA